MAKSESPESFKSTYDHLNKDQPYQLHLTLDLDELADIIVSMNYGVVRFLAALVRARARQWKKQGWEGPDELLEGIMELLQKKYT